MRSVDVVIHVIKADRGAAEAHGAAVGSLCRQLESGRPHGLLPGVERAIATIFLEVGLGAVGQKDAPRGLEGLASGFEALARPLLRSARLLPG